MNAGDGPLQGVTVLDLTSVLMGPFTTQILGDYGADVIKVEPSTGDSSCGLAPMKNPGMGSAFLQLNRNKRSIVLDLPHPDGHQAVMRLFERADILISASGSASSMKPTFRHFHCTPCRASARILT